jgi:hypothetical protein
VPTARAPREGSLPIKRIQPPDDRDSNEERTMRGALKITFNDGKEEFFEVDAIGDVPDFVARFDAFLSRPTVTLVTDDEIIVIPSGSIRHYSITRASKLVSLDALHAIPGVLVGAKRVMG